MNPEKPEPVKRALQLLWLGLAAGPIRSFMEFPKLIAESNVPNAAAYIYGGAVIAIVFAAWLNWMIGKRKNWARWLFTVFLVIGTPMSIQQLSKSLENFPISGVLGCAQLLAQFAAAYLLFRPLSREWFKKVPGPLSGRVVSE